MEDAVIAQRETAESNHDCDQLVQPVLRVVPSKGDCGRNEDDRVVCVIELDAVTIDESDGRMGAEARDGELFQQVLSDLNGCLGLARRIFLLR